jgi:hypothetical protein
MAILYPAEIKPTKLELLNQWLPSRPWYHGPAAPDLERVTSYRFDDPLGEVGVETLIVRTPGGPLLQTPLTYRAAPLDRADEFLIGTMSHSVLGKRWVYDACGDPVYAATLAATIITGSSQAEEFVDVDGELRVRPPSIAVLGSGIAAAVPADVISVDDLDPAVIVTDSVELSVARVLASGPVALDDERGTLVATWAGQAAPLLLATLAV